MQLNIELNEHDIKQLILDHLKEKTNLNIKLENIKILVKSNQNYRSEWETANFKATLDSYKF